MSIRKDDLDKSANSTASQGGPQNKFSKFKRAPVNGMLVDGEELVVEAKIHWAIYWKAVAVFILAVIVGLIIFELGVLLAVSAFVMFVHATLRKEILMLVLTNKRVLLRYGILQVDVVDMRFSKIESVELERMLPGYLLGYANVVLMGTGQRYVGIPYVGNAVEFRRAYNKLTLEDDEL